MARSATVRQDGTMSQGPRQVTSPKNPLVRTYRDAAGGEPADVMLVEGTRLLREALQAGLAIRSAAVSPRLRDDALRADLSARAEQFVECGDDVLERMSAVETHQGAVAVVQRPEWREADLLGKGISPLVVAAAGVRDPGNLGAVLRTAEAAGATGVLALAGGADPFREKAVRGSMGSVFRLPVLAGTKPQQVVEFARRHLLQLVVADGNATNDYLRVDLRKPTLLVVGAEAQGVPPELLAAADQRMRIGIAPTVESLNVAVASGVILFEARRQRL